MIGKLLAAAIWRMVPPKRKPDFLIGPNLEDPYMRRWWILPRNKVFNIYLHHMRHDDDDRAPHDHPWWSLSLCLHGHIEEHELLPQDEEFIEWLGPTLGQNMTQEFRVNHIRKGDWKWRGKEYAHFLKLPDGDAWTLFITGPKIRKWGFHCPKGWLPWDKFVDPEDPGKPGRGCGELS
jgi:hypothetical protein